MNALGGICDWQGRGGVGDGVVVDNDGRLTVPIGTGLIPPQVQRSGYMGKISELIAKQLQDGATYGVGSITSVGSMEAWLEIISQAIYGLSADQIGDAADTWRLRLEPFMTGHDHLEPSVNEGGFLIRLVERLMRRIQRRWYILVYGETSQVSTVEIPPRIVVTAGDETQYRRPLLPASLSTPPVPTVLPFHTFTYPVTPRETRLISHRTGLRISHNTLNQPWLPAHVYPPPPPPHNGKISIGYVSSDFGNHPLSHLMQSVFGFHDLSRFNVFCYATSLSDGSSYRLKIESESQNFVDASQMSTQQLIDQIISNGIHILVNMSGYTKGARNEVFAARPAPIQMSYMGFAGTLAAGWCDYFIVGK